MTSSRTDFTRPALVTGLLAGLCAIQLSFASPVFAQSADQAAPPEAKETVQKPAPALSQTNDSDRVPHRRFYLGPNGANSPQETGSDRQNTADHAPTSILIGPYLPEDSIVLPQTGPFLATDDPETLDGTRGSDTRGPESFGEDEGVLADVIAIDSLEQLDPAAIGVWTDEQTDAFPVNMWNGSRRAVLGTLLPALSANPASPTTKSLFRRLLLSPATIPSMPDREQDHDTTEDDVQFIDEATGTVAHPLLLARLERLYTAGLLDDFLTLADHLRADVADEEITRLHTNALLVKGDHDQACALARSAIGQSGAAHWLRIVAMCEALDGKRAATHLQLALLDDAGEGNALFNTLVERLLTENAGGTPNNLPNQILNGEGSPTPTLYALFRLTGTAIPDSLALAAPAVLLQPLAGNPDLSVDTRLALAEKGAKSGLVTGESLAAIFSSLTFTDANRQAVFASLEESNNPDSVPSDQNLDQIAGSGSSSLVTGPRLDALLWQQVARADSAAERIRWIEIAYEHGSKKGLAFAMAEALREPLLSVDASMSLGGYADSAGTIHLLNGNHSAARAWYEAARLAAESGNPDAKRAQSALWPLLAIADNSGTVPFDAEHLTRWWDGHASMDPSARLVLGDRFFTRLGDLGMDVPQNLLDAVLPAPSIATTTPPSILWRQMLDAIRHKRLGETVLTSLAAIDDEGLAQTSPALLSATITGLRMVGLEDDARRLAFETMIANGL